MATPPHSFPASPRQSSRLLPYPPYPAIIAVVEQEVEPTAARTTRNGQAVSRPERGSAFVEQRGKQVEKGWCRPREESGQCGKGLTMGV